MTMTIVREDLGAAVQAALADYETAVSHWDWADADLRDAAAMALTAAETRLNALLARRRAQRAGGAA